jgi:hypothetical protein
LGRGPGFGWSGLIFIGIPLPEQCKQTSEAANFTKPVEFRENGMIKQSEQLGKTE